MSLKRIGIIALTLATSIASAQEFRVYTKIIQERRGDYAAAKTTSRRVASDSNSPPRIAGRSLSLFRASKVYDLVVPNGEVIIFEQGEKRFTALKPSKRMAVIITFKELDQMVEESRDNLQEKIAFVSASENELQEAEIELLQFQLSPEFRTRYDEGSRQLRLSSSLIEYTTETVPARTPEVCEDYLRYADRMAELNFVLHPHALLPDPRLELNQELRERGLIPTRVSLRAGPLQLRAEHSFGWELTSADRQLIHQWEEMLNDPELSIVSIEEYRAAR